MISLPFRRPRGGQNIAGLYGMIVTQARLPTFYRDYGVPDTVEGRLDMVMLHIVLVLRRLAGPGRPLPPEGQALFDVFCQDIDDNLREMGVGDFAVPKRMQKVGEAFYGRARAYEAALSDSDPAALEQVVGRNVFGEPEPSLGARRLAAYMRGVARRLSVADAAALARAEFVFPDPAAVAAPVATA